MTGKVGLAGLRDGLRLGHYVKGPSLRSVHSDFGELGDHRLGAVLAGSTDGRLHVIAPVRKPNENETGMPTAPAASASAASNASKPATNARQIVRAPRLLPKVRIGTTREYAA